MQLTKSNDVSASTYDTIVVGNGALGLSLGLELARHGSKVAVVGRFSRPFAASPSAGAMNGCFGEVTPSLLRSPYGRLKLEMDIEATRLWDDWSDLLIENSDESRIRTAKGTVVILNTIGVPEIDTAGYASIRQALEEHGEAYEDVDPADIDWLDPVPTSRPLQAMFIPGEHAVDTPALLRALNATAERMGASLVDAHVRRLLMEGDRVAGVELESGETMSSANVVLAAGANSYSLLDGIPEVVRAKIPAMVSGCGVALIVKTVDRAIPSSVIRTPNRAFACGLHVVPRSEGCIYLGATNEIIPHPSDSAAIGEINLLLGGIRQLRADLVNGYVEEILVGNRPVPLDGFPLIGNLEEVPGLWMMTGTYRDGLHQSPLLAREMASRILGGPRREKLDVFAPVRPPLIDMTREQCLETAIQHTMAVGYEHDWKLPEDFPGLIEDEFRRSFTQAIENIDPEFVPPPEILFFVDSEIHAGLRRYYDAHRDTPLALDREQKAASLQTGPGGRRRWGRHADRS